MYINYHLSNEHLLLLYNALLHSPKNYGDDEMRSTRKFLFIKGQLGAFSTKAKVIEKKTLFFKTLDYLILMFNTINIELTE